MNGRSGQDSDRNEAADAFVEPVLRGRHVYLRAVLPQDYPMLQQLDTASEVSVRWRFRGAAPSPDQWLQMASNNVLAQFLVARRRDDLPIGLVIAYRPNLPNKHAYFGAIALDRGPSPLMAFGCALFLEYVFTCWDLHKLYMESPEYNLRQFGAGLGSYFVEEGRLRGHSFYGGRMWDEVILALYRDTWRERGVRLLEAERSGKPHITGVRLRGEGQLWSR